MNPLETNKPIRCDTMRCDANQINTTPSILRINCIYFFYEFLSFFLSSSSSCYYYYYYYSWQLIKSNQIKSNQIKSNRYGTVLYCTVLTRTSLFVSRFASLANSFGVFFSANGLYFWKVLILYYLLLLLLHVVDNFF